MKEFIEFLQIRVNSPFYYYLIIAFIGWNWRELLILYAGNEEILSRIEYFDANTTTCSKYLFPLSTAIFMTLAYPWINYYSFKYTKEPRDRKNEVVADSEHLLLKTKKILEEARRVYFLKFTAEEELINSPKVEPKLSEPSNDEYHISHENKKENENFYKYQPTNETIEPLLNPLISNPNEHILQNHVNLEFAKEEASNPQLRIEKAQSIFDYGKQYITRGEYQQAIYNFDLLLKNFEKDDNTKIKKLISEAISEKINCLIHLNKDEELIEYLDELITKFRNDLEALDENFKNRYIEALFHKGLFLSKLDRYQDSIYAYDEFLSEYEKNNDSGIEIMVGRALFGKGFAWNMLNDPEKALTFYDEFLDRFENTNIQILKISVAKALFNKATINYQKQNKIAAIEVFGTLLKHFDNIYDLKLLKQVVMAFYFKEDLSNNESSINAYEQLFELIEKTYDKELYEWVAKAFFNKGKKQIESGNSKDAINTYDLFLKCFSNSQMPELNELIAMTYMNKAITLFKLKANETDMIAVYDELLNRFEKTDQINLHVFVANALFNKGTTLLALGKKEDGRITLNRLLDHFKDSKIPKVQEFVVQTKQIRNDFIHDF
jgi:tetratricopeptide (TPR) repeat protein